MLRDGVNGTAGWTYTPAEGFSAEDTFTYRVYEELTNRAATGIVRITVGTYTPPTVEAQQYYTIAPKTVNVFLEAQGGMKPYTFSFNNQTTVGTLGPLNTTIWRSTYRYPRNYCNLYGIPDNASYVVTDAAGQVGVGATRMLQQ